MDCSIIGCCFMDSTGETPQPPHLVDEQVLTLLQGPILGTVLFLSPLLVSYVVVAQLIVTQLLHSHTVSQLTQSQLDTASLMGKHGTYHLNLVQVVKCWVPAVMFIAGYWKCLTTMGSTMVANFCCGYLSLSFTGPRELKTPTPSARCIY